MARYTEAKCKLCRREGMKLFLKGRRCDSAKCPFEGQKRRDQPPGQHAWRRGKASTYSKGLREKQKCKRVYGLLDKPFMNYFHEAARRKGNTGDNLLVLLERRLDNVVRRLGFATSRAQARQLVAHGHVFVNAKRVDIPSFQVRSGDEVTIGKGEKVRDLVKESIDFSRRAPMASWLAREDESLKGTILNLPLPGEVEQPLQMQLIIEFCAK